MNKRNTPCFCGSGKKYKNCHYLIDHEDKKKIKIPLLLERSSSKFALKNCIPYLTSITILIIAYTLWSFNFGSPIITASYFQYWLTLVLVLLAIFSLIYFLDIFNQSDDDEFRMKFVVTLLTSVFFFMCVENIDTAIKESHEYPISIKSLDEIKGYPKTKYFRLGGVDKYSMIYDFFYENGGTKFVHRGPLQYTFNYCSGMLIQTESNFYIRECRNKINYGREYDYHKIKERGMVNIISHQKKIKRLLQRGIWLEKVKRYCPYQLKHCNKASTHLIRIEDPRDNTYTAIILALVGLVFLIITPIAMYHLTVKSVKAFLYSLGDEAPNKKIKRDC